MEDGAPAFGSLVGGEDHGAPSDVALVDDVEEDVGGVIAVGEITDFVDDEDVRFEISK